MIVGLGIDLTSVSRIGDVRGRHGDRFLERVFTEAEIALCTGRKDEDRGLAARFAAKEAAMKALGTGLAGGIAWRDVEVVNGPGGKPDLVLRGAALEKAKDLGAQRHLVSLTHDGDYACAVVVLEG